MCTASPEGGAVPSLLDGNGIEFQPLDVVNWKDYPYKPEVSFRIAHTGREILLHYKVKEAMCVQWPPETMAGYGRCLCGILRISRR